MFAVLVARALRRPTAARCSGWARASLGLLLTWTLTDHSRTGVQAWLGVPAATVHLLAMALWFGGLALLLVRARPRPHGVASPSCRGSRRLALGCFAALGVTGVYLAWRQAGELAALPATEFGRLLLIKSGIVLAIVGLAALSRRGRATRRRALRRTVLVEAVLGVVVLGVTAGLVNAAPARVSYSKPIDVTVTGVEGGRSRSRSSRPSRARTSPTSTCSSPTGGCSSRPEIEARLRKGDTVAAGRADPRRARPLRRDRLTVPAPGDWTLRLTVRTCDIDEQTIDVP